MGEKRFQGTFGRGIFSFLFVGILLIACVCPVSGEIVGTGDPNSFEPAALDSAGDFNPSICDIGIGYSVTKGLVGHDGRINIADLAVLSIEWLRTCSTPNWCNGADLDHSGTVEINDLMRFVDCWMYADRLAPQPNPAQWGTRREMIQGDWVLVDGRPMPKPGTLSDIIMTAAPAIDNWGWAIAYRFEGKKTFGTGTVNSPWMYYPQDIEPTWIVRGLSENTSYTFTVCTAEIRIPGTLQQAGYFVNPNGFTIIKDLDVNPNLPLFSNWTDPSIPASATTGHDTDPPTGIAWLVQPYQSSPRAVTMEAAPAVDASTPLTYQFRRYATPYGWEYIAYFGQMSRLFTDTNVQTGKSYTYSFVARDKYGNTSIEAPIFTVTIR